MEAKFFFKNKGMCVLPWTGFQLEPNGDIKNCIIAKKKLGNIGTQQIEKIMTSDDNNSIKESMVQGPGPDSCSGCHLQELHRNDALGISSRQYYNKEILPNTDPALFDQPLGFQLKHVDLRWNNHCNQACVYCGPQYSSKWANELKQQTPHEDTNEIEQYVMDRAKDLVNVYLAGGEPLIMNQNKKMLRHLLDVNPDVNIRINTNLSSTQTGVFDLVCKFSNVHWTVSVESTGQQYDYIRYHGDWNTFHKNLRHIKSLPHKISFNMLYFILNHRQIFHTVEHFRHMGFHDNSFIIGPLYQPTALNVMNLPTRVLDECLELLKDNREKSEGFLTNSYDNIIKYIEETAWTKRPEESLRHLKEIDNRRGVESSKLFPHTYEDLDVQ